MIFTFILVETSTPKNIGVATRVMKPMVFKDLRLTNPGNYLNEPARWLAHAANNIHRNTMVFSSLTDITKNTYFKIGTIAKNDYLPLPGLTNFLKQKIIHNRMQH